MEKRRGKPRATVVVPDCNAPRTREKTHADIPRDMVQGSILVDDVSRDETVEIARRFGVKVMVHMQNTGYGGNQKTCHIEELRDIVSRRHHAELFRPQLLPETR